jgi:hypothetical protein
MSQYWEASLRKRKKSIKNKRKQLAQTENGKTTTTSGILTMRSIWDSAQLYIVLE